MRRWPAGLAAVFLAALAAGCQEISIREVRRGSWVGRAGESRRVPAIAGVPADVLQRPGGSPSQLDDTCPGAAASPGCPRLVASGPDGLPACAATCDHACRRTARDAAPRSELDRLADAVEALHTLGAGPGTRPDDPGPARDRASYNAALEAFLRGTAGRRMRLDRTWQDDLAARGIRVAFGRGPAALPPSAFDELLFAGDYAVRGLVPEYRAEGIGIPLIAVRRFRPREFAGRRGQEKFLMPRQVYPLTAVLRPAPPSADGAEAPGFRLDLLDPLQARRVELAGRDEPLAADLTTPLAYQFARNPLPILQEVGLLDPQWLEELKGLYMLHPYQPGKIPVLLVHGLRSSPVAWMKVINELRGDAVLRDRYQVWLFLYPTGTPFPASAADLRRALDELRQAVDPHREDAALDRMVLVGHSMGGLIAKMTALESGNALWDLVAERPFEELRAAPEDRAWLRRVFFFGPHPSVRRLVFIATPHRGSELGDQFIGRLTDRLIRLPGALRTTYRGLLAQNGPDFFRPEIRGKLPTSVAELRRDNRLLLTLAGLPMGPGVVCHSIIARESEDGPLESSSDGVVPYASAHLDVAESECIVHGDHGCQDSREAIREIRRILYLHLGQPGGAAGAPPDASPWRPDSVSMARPGLP